MMQAKENTTEKLTHGKEVKGLPCWICYNQTVQNIPAMQESRVQSLSWQNPLDKVMASPSSILTLRTPRTEELGELQSRGCKELDSTKQLTQLKSEKAT